MKRQFVSLIMVSSIVVGLFTLVVSSAFADGTITQHVVNPNQDENALSESCELIAKTVQAAKRGDYVGAITSDGKKIFSFSADDKNPMIIRKHQAKAMNDLRTWFLQQTSSSRKSAKLVDTAGSLARTFQFCNAKTGKYARCIIIMHSCAIHRDKNISFVGKYPGDAFANHRKISVFAKIPNVTRKNVEVVFITSGDAFTSVVQEIQLKRFYELLLYKRAARLTGWVADFETAQEIIRKPSNTQGTVPPQPENWDGDLILYRVVEEENPSNQTGYLEKVNKNAAVAVKLASKNTEHIEKATKAATVTVKTVPKPVSTKVLSLSVDNEANVTRVWVTIDPHTIPPESIRAENFQIRESINGKTREIPPDTIELQSKANNPLTVMLIRDVSPSMQSHSEDSARAIRAFLAGMEYNDRAAIVYFARNFLRGESFTTNEPFTTNKDMLSSTLKNPSLGAGTSLFDALLESLLILEDLSTRNARVLVAFSDGEDTSSFNTADRVFEAAKTASIPIFLVLVGEVIQEEELKMIAEGSGGMLIRASNTQALKGAYEHISRLISESLILSFPTSCKAGDDLEISGKVEVPRGENLFEGKISAQTTVR